MADYRWYRFERPTGGLLSLGIPPNIDILDSEADLICCNIDEYYCIKERLVAKVIGKTNPMSLSYNSIISDIIKYNEKDYLIVKSRLFNDSDENEEILVLDRKTLLYISEDNCKEVLAKLAFIER